MSEGVSRNLEAMQRFAQQLQEYETQMRAACQQGRQSAQQAQGCMKDDMGRQAAVRIETIMKAIQDGLPGITELIAKLEKSNAILGEASGMRL